MSLTYVSIENLPVIAGMRSQLTASSNDVWPSNPRLRFWSCKLNPNFESTTFIPSADGWVGYRRNTYSGTLSRTAKMLRIADTDHPGNYYIRAQKNSGNREVSQINICRPFTVEETKPLLSSGQVTLSFDWLCGDSLQSEYPPHIRIFGHTSAESETQEQVLKAYAVEGGSSYDYGLTFETSPVIILDAELPITTSGVTRISKTFSIPSGLQQLAVCFYYQNTNTYDNVGANCWIQVGRFRLDRGATAYGFEDPDPSLEQLRNGLRYQCLCVGAAGQLDENMSVTQYPAFHQPYSVQPTCIYAVDINTPENMIAANALDPVVLDPVNDLYVACSVTRWGNQSAVSECSFCSRYTIIDKKLW